MQVTIPVVENPRRKKRRTRRKLSAKQIAAGFGGKRHMTTKRRKTKSRKVTRRRNPSLAALANPRRRVRRRRNPGIGKISNIFNIKLATGVAIGLFAPNIIVNQVKSRFFAALPNTGLTGTAVRIGAAIVASYATKRFLKQSEIAKGIIAGAVGFELYQMAQTYLLPKLGLSGVNTYYPTSDAASLNGYESGESLNTYYPTVEEMSY